MRLSGATVIFAEDANQIGELMDKAMDDYVRQGLNPYYIWGGGHTLEGGKAYIDAVDELNQYCEKNEWFPDYIFLASGTGSTQSGLLAGLDKYQIDATVIGISVGRKAELARTIVKDFYVQLCREYRITCKYKSSIVLDQYLCGGYGKFNAEISDLCDNSIKDFGFILDTCYSGKAFYGMMDYMEQNNINKKNVLFWHTGGIFNFLAD